MPKEQMPDVVVLVPGITGSVLKWRDEIVWGLSLKAGLRALFSSGKYITRKLKLQDDTDPERETLDDEISAVSVIPDLHLIPGLWKIDGYTLIADVIKREFDVTPGRNYFKLPYD